MGLRATAIEFIVHDAIALLLNALFVQNASSESVISYWGDWIHSYLPHYALTVIYVVNNVSVVTAST